MPAFPFRPLRWPATVAVAGIGVGEGVHLLGLTLSAIGLPTHPYGTLSGTGALLTMLGILLDATGGIAFLVWLYRAAYNIRGLPGRYPRWSPGRVVGVWFIPLANLVLGPYGLRDVALNSVPDGDPDRRSQLEGLLNAWWACYVLVTGAGYLMSLVSPDNVVGLVITGAGLGAAAALIIVLIRRITLIQLSELNARGWLG